MGSDPAENIEMFSIIKTDSKIQTFRTKSLPLPNIFKLALFKQTKFYCPTNRFIFDFDYLIFLLVTNIFVFFFQVCI